ncbi:MAG: hypothetical protein EZS28_050651, partial [Streblomastix strix]
MMTKLRANGATKAEVNVWTRHSITSDVVDTFYFKPVERDLGEIIAKFEGSIPCTQFAVDEDLMREV